MTPARAAAVAAAAAILGGCAGAALARAGAAPPGVTKTTLRSLDFPAPVWRVVTVRTRIEPGAEVPPHAHPGVETALVVSGRGRLRRAGRPEETLGPGGSFLIPEGTPHALANAGREPLVVVSTYVVRRDRPIASPASLGADPAR